MKWIIWFLGKNFKFVRAQYHKRTKGRWLWGLVGYINDYQSENPKLEEKYSHSEFVYLCKDLFNYPKTEAN